jgi:hypothetical protein
MLALGKYSIGVGDRFALQARAQLEACRKAADQGVEVIPVWNKSNREHVTIGSEPASVRAAADAAVRELKWTRPYHVDADHIRLETVARFLADSDFFTIDVADLIGRPAPGPAISAFVERHGELLGEIPVTGMDKPLEISRADLAAAAGKFLQAVQEAGRIYRRIEQVRGRDRFITEVSMDETDNAQTPTELLVILAALADEGVPVQTVAPKFTGRFNKGVDYSGDLEQFEREFNADLAVIGFAVGKYRLPAGLKLSVHSGSDKFSIYTPIRRALARFDAGLHLKTAGTTWLEELIGLAEADGDGLALARDIYSGAVAHVVELCAPYSAVIDIDATRLPSSDTVQGWDARQFVEALRHDPSCPAFNPHLRQLLHVGYKVAARMGDRYLELVRRCERTISRNVTENLYERHIKPLFIGGP